MGRLLRHDERLDDSTGQAARGQTGRGWGKLAAVDGKVLALVDKVGGQFRLQDRTSSWRHGGKDIGRDTCHDTDVEK